MIEMSSRSPQRTLYVENEQLRRVNSLLEKEVLSLRFAFDGLRNLVQLVNQASGEIDEFKLLETITEASISSIEASDGSILLLDQETNELVFANSTGTIRDRLIGHRIPANTGIAGWVASHREPVIVPNVNLDPRFSQSIDRRFQFKTHSLVCVPLLYDGKIIGVIQGVNKKHGKVFNQSDLIILQVVAHMAAWAISMIEAKYGEGD